MRHILYILAVMLPSLVYSANITSISGVAIVPSNPSPGDTVTLTWDYVMDSAFNSPASLVVVSDQCALRNATPNQMVVVGNSCASGGTQVSGGCVLGSNKPSGTNTETRSITIPSTLVPGFTYYVAVGMKDYNCYINPSLDVQAQNCVSFTIPLPPPYVTLDKVAEGSAAAPGGNVLYTIFYDAANTNGLTISNAIPSDMTFIEAYDGGVYSAGTVTWNIGNITSPVKGSVSFLVQVNGGTTAGTVINDSASATSSGASGVSNDTPVTVGAALKISKFAKPSTVAVGQTITYNITYTNEGYAMSEYVNFDSAADIAGWDSWGGGAPPADWQVTGGYLLQNENASSVNWPSLSKPSPLLHDAMYITDLFIPSESSTAYDAVFKFNVIDHNNWYQLVLQADNDSLMLQKSVGGTGSNPGGGSKTYPDILSDTWYTVKVQVSGANIKFRCWKRGDPEPVTWDVSVNDASLPAAGTAGYQANQGRVRADNLKIFTPVPATHLRVWDTLPACITYVGCDQGCTQSGGVVTWDFPGVQGNTVNTVSFWAVADICANNSVVTNKALMDSDEPAPGVVSGDATVVVGAIDSPTFTATRTYTNTYTSTPTPTPSYTSTPTASYTATLSHTASPTAPGTFTNTPTITPTPTASNTPTDTLTFTPTMTYSSTYTVTPTRTPAPADIQVTFTAVDPATSVGGYAEFRITVRNAGTAASGLTLSEVIPADVTFEENPSDAGGNSGWAYSGGTITRVLSPADITLLNSGSTLTFYFTVKTSETLSSGAVINFSAVDALYNDQIFTGAHSYSLPAFVTVGDIVVYPNPFNPSTAIGNKLKFANLPRDTQIIILTLNSEQIVAFNAQSAYVYWDGKNAYGKDVAPGIYYYILKYNEGRTRLVGKIFVMKQ